MQIIPINPLPPPELKGRYAVRGPSILFTINDLTTIRDYVHAFGRLPLTEEAIATSFDTSVKTLGPIMLSSIMALNESMVAHTKTWPKIEEDTRVLGSELESFARSFVTTGEAAVGYIKATPAWSKFGNYEGVTDLPIPDTLDASLEEADRDALVTLEGLLDYMERQVDSYLQRVGEVHDLVRVFKKTLDYDIEARVDDANQALLAFDFDNVISDRVAHIATLQDQLKTARADLARFESNANYSWSFLLIGRAVVYLWQADAAEDAQRRIEHALQAIESQRKNIRLLTPFKEQLLSYGLTLVDLRQRLEAVEKASGNLLSLWRKFKGDLSTSKREFSHIDSQTKLTVFMVVFDNIVAPLQDVLENSKALNALYEAFDESYQPPARRGSDQ